MNSSYRKYQYLRVSPELSDLVCSFSACSIMTIDWDNLLPHVKKRIGLSSLVPVACVSRARAEAALAQC
jgi:hypothetical protein